MELSTDQSAPKGFQFKYCSSPPCIWSGLLSDTIELCPGCSGAITSAAYIGEENMLKQQAIEYRDERGDNTLWKEWLQHCIEYCEMNKENK